MLPSHIIGKSVTVCDIVQQGRVTLKAAEGVITYGPKKIYVQDKVILISCSCKLMNEKGRRAFAVI